MVLEHSKYLGRTHSLFEADLLKYKLELETIYENASVLVLGGAGSIGRAVCKTLLSFRPKSIDIVDISENNLVELTRDIRSSDLADKTNIRFVCLDIGGEEFVRMFEAYGPYDYVYNLTALKHVRSEENEFTLLRMLQTNIFNSVKAYQLAQGSGAKAYFCVSTDKAADPTNVMGATKLLMEKSLGSVLVPNTKVVLARFANVLFSDGSLPFGFKNRIEKNQPLSVPEDIQRYFIAEQEAGELCVISGSLGNSSEIFFPKTLQVQDAQYFTDIAKQFLTTQNYQPKIYSSEKSAKSSLTADKAQGAWPCYFFKTNTTGEKYIEEFFTSSENVLMDKFQTIGIIQPAIDQNFNFSEFFLQYKSLASGDIYTKADIVEFLRAHLPNFHHIEKNASLNARM